MDLIVSLLLEFFGQILLELLLEAIFGIGDVATGGRLRRVFVLLGVGLLAGVGSHFVAPQTLIQDPLARYATVAGLTLGGGLFLAAVESRFRKGGPGSAAAGFLSGVAFSLGYVVGRRLLHI